MELKLNDYFTLTIIEKDNTVKSDIIVGVDTNIKIPKGGTAKEQLLVTDKGIEISKVDKVSAQTSNRNRMAVKNVNDYDVNLNIDVESFKQWLDKDFILKDTNYVIVERKVYISMIDVYHQARIGEFPERVIRGVENTIIKSTTPELVGKKYIVGMMDADRILDKQFNQVGTIALVDFINTLHPSDKLLLAQCKHLENLVISDFYTLNVTHIVGTY